MKHKSKPFLFKTVWYYKPSKCKNNIWGGSIGDLATDNIATANARVGTMGNAFATLGWDISIPCH